MAGCASIPPGADAPREHSVALAQPDATTLGKAFAERIREHGSMAGFRLLPAGTDGFILRAEMAASAQRTIDLQYFIFHADKTGKLLMDELLQAADRGVRLRILLDDLHVKGEDAQVTLLAAHPNIEVRLFNPSSYRGPIAPLRTMTSVISRSGATSSPNCATTTSSWTCCARGATPGNRNRSTSTSRSAKPHAARTSPKWTASTKARCDRKRSTTRWHVRSASP
jgi:hypothetical protein